MLNACPTEIDFDVYQPRKPPPRANGPPTEAFIIYDESSTPGVDDYIIDADYAMETYL